MLNFFKNLFGKNKSSIPKLGAIKDANLTREQFYRTDLIKTLLNKYRKDAIILNPRKSNNLLLTASKMGGLPNLWNFEDYPICKSCNSPLNFVFQLWKRDFPEFYFPHGKNLFQLFRCPNFDCADASIDESDLKMFHFYFSNDYYNEKSLFKPQHHLTEFEAEVNECKFQPEGKVDYPAYDEYSEFETKEIESHFSENLIDDLQDNYLPVQRTKLGGYPSFTQNVFYPECKCGSIKEFFFQLSSEDNDGKENSADFGNDDYWSHHGIMIGDVGNVYYYICKECGEESIQSYWDCC